MSGATAGRRGRPRGRPRGSGGQARDRILAAAIEDFGAHGYDATTLRGIAERAGVDSALIHHYFGTKADLFTAAIGAPIRPDVDVPSILAGPKEQLGESLVRYILESWDRPDVHKRGTVLLRSAIGNRMMTPLLAEFLSRELLSRITAQLQTADAQLRASLAASQIAGLLVTRYLLKLPGIADASIDDLVARVGPTLQRYLTE